MLDDVIGSLGGSSLGLHNVQTAFDVRKESDVIALLKLIHQNPIEPEVKNQLRDFIFAYRTDQTPVNLSLLCDACALLGITVLQTSVAPKVLQKNLKSVVRVNRGRPLPSFSQPQVTALTPDVIKVEVTKTPVADVVPRVIESVQEPQTQKISEPQVPIIDSQNQRIPVVSVDLASIQARIAEIKHQINQKVGNPINLIETHNELGRAYMDALLNAMKKANGGALGEIAIAMVSLEKLFTQVMSAIENNSTVQNTPSVSETVPPQQVQVKETTQENRVMQQEVVVRSVPLEVKSQIAPAQVTIVNKARTLEQKLAELKAKAAQQAVSPIVSEPLTKPVIKLVPNHIPSDVPPSVVNMQTTESVTVPVKESAPAVPSESHMHSVAKDKQLQDLLRSNREKDVLEKEAQDKVAISKMDPFFTPEVTSGLSQLLSEWSLFKSSGFFGTGPSGKDHSLYLRLAPLTMATVIAGRFEGATPLIKQSIADYMNGWRYEDGIIHEHGETFEHYLRKVVHHIINKKRQTQLKR